MRYLYLCCFFLALLTVEIVAVVYLVKNIQCYREPLIYKSLRLLKNCYEMKRIKPGGAGNSNQVNSSDTLKKQPALST